MFTRLLRGSAWGHPLKIELGSVLKYKDSFRPDANNLNIKPILTQSREGEKLRRWRVKELDWCRIRVLLVVFVELVALV